MRNAQIARQERKGRERKARKKNGCFSGVGEDSGVHGWVRRR